MQNLWEEISVKKTPGTMPVPEDFWQKFNSESKLLEVGCAWGRIVFECLKRNLKVLGTDINKNEIKLLQKTLANQNISTDKAHVTYDNILHSKLSSNQFDGAILLGVLGAMPKLKRAKCLSEINRLVKPKSFIHISEFELNESETSFKERYNNDFKITGEYGTLSVTNEDGTELYRTHNFSVEEISELISNQGFILVKLVKDTFISYHGNKKPGLMITIQKA